MMNIEYDEDNIYNDDNDDDCQDDDNVNHNDVGNYDNVLTKHLKTDQLLVIKVS